MKDFSKDVVAKVIKAYGGVKEAQAKLNYDTTMTVYNWRQKGIPISKVPAIHLQTGIPVKELVKGVDGGAGI